ncbi:MAG TPA: hypothetical protein VGG28_14215 [Kofleriaceae bacterium]
MSGDVPIAVRSTLSNTIAISDASAMDLVQGSAKRGQAQAQSRRGLPGDVPISLRSTLSNTIAISDASAMDLVQGSANRGQAQAQSRRGLSGDVPIAVRSIAVEHDRNLRRERD